MRKLFDRSRWGFFFLCLAAYLLAQNLGWALSRRLGLPFAGEAVLDLTLALGLYAWARRQGLCPWLALGPLQVPAKSLLWFLPLALCCSSNLWNGVAVTLPPAALAAGLVALVCAAFLEEVLVRGLLFRLLAEKSLPLAVTVTTVCFGLAHLLNLFSPAGGGLCAALLQTAAALAFGLLFAVLLVRDGSLWPCILAHGAINGLSLFGNGDGLTPARQVLFLALELALVLGYLAWLVKTAPRPRK